MTPLLGKIGLNFYRDKMEKNSCCVALAVIAAVDVVSCVVLAVTIVVGFVDYC